MESMRTLDEARATERLEQHLAAAVAVLEPTPRLTPASFLTTPCDDPTDHGPLGRVQVSRSYWLDGAGATAVDALYEHWTRAGYRVLEDGRHRTVLDADGRPGPAPRLWVEHDGDGFRLTLYANRGGDLSLAATSPCIWPAGQPA